MLKLPVYMDNHATTRVDSRVIDALLPFFSEDFGNAGSTSHSFGWDAKNATDRARESIAASIGAKPREIVFTSGATESNNLAICGFAERARRGNHIISVVTEHKAVLDPINRLQRRGYQVTWLPVPQQRDTRAGMITAQQVADAITDDTILVSVMLANNEIGAVQPVAEIGAVCRERGVILHSDATQAVGRMPVNVQDLQLDLMSFSAHKLYGPKGIGALYVRRRGSPVRLHPLIVGGGQEFGFRSGTLNVPGIVGFATAIELCQDEMPVESKRLQRLRQELYQGLQNQIADISLNGPPLDVPQLRLGGNLNISFSNVDGEALMMSMGNLAVSSGSACTSANPEPSHVLRALGLNDDQTRSSLRFGLGRFNTLEEVEFAISTTAEAVGRLRALSNSAKTASP